MKDCSKCPKRPQPGAYYKDTACADCRPWEPQDDKATAQMPSGWWESMTDEAEQPKRKKR